VKKPKKKGGLRTFRYRGCTVTVWWWRERKRSRWYFAATIPGRPRLLMTDQFLERGRRSILQGVDAALAEPEVGRGPWDVPPRGLPGWWEGKSRRERMRVRRGLKITRASRATFQEHNWHRHDAGVLVTEKFGAPSDGLPGVRGELYIRDDVDAVLASRVALLQGWMDRPALGDAFERRTTAQVVEALGGGLVQPSPSLSRVVDGSVLDHATVAAKRVFDAVVVNDAVPADMVVALTTRVGSFLESIMKRTDAVVAVGLVDAASLLDPNTVVMDFGDEDVTVTHPEGRS